MNPNRGNYRISDQPVSAPGAIDNHRHRQPYTGNKGSVGITNAFTVDVEDYFQVAAFSGSIAREEWDTAECRVESNVYRILELMSANETHGTFFFLGWIAKRYPNLVSEVAACGHEIASHGVEHEKATEQSQQAFKNDIVDSKRLLEDISGSAVIGYRAPSFSVCESNLWVYGILEEAGYQYSSSIYPIKHDHYGMPNASRFPFPAAAGVREIPATTVRIGSVNWPAAGGGYFRLMPYAWSRWCINRVNSAERQPAIFYCHPWEIDPQQPVIRNVSLKSKFRHYVNLSRTHGRLNRLLADFHWDRIDRVFAPEIYSSHESLARDD